MLQSTPHVFSVVLVGKKRVASIMRSKNPVEGRKGLAEGDLGVCFPGDRPGCSAAHGGRHGCLIHDFLSAGLAADQCGYCEAHGVHGKPG